MDSKSPHSQAGFLHSINLMLLGGLLLLALIVASNKLLIHYLWRQSALPNTWLGNLAQTEAQTFRIFSTTELYLTWFAFLIALIGLIGVLVKLIKTWKD
jgi:hypothetical protein